MADNGYIEDPFEEIPDFTFKKYSTKTYKLNLENNKIQGKTDDLEALKLTIYKILNTERYENAIYSWNYGIEFRDIIGMPISLAIPTIERRISEALMQDDRIEKVDSFEFERKKGIIHVKFVVHTKYGSLDIDKEVAT
ncbi:DUF2634 domain-containing protein [Metaclostridioides mangenotii]|uniref:DUF2634 domain-containing protein n=1 Tax=Metaclostridioides mangenotii TaxID=1540 RepID=UPI0004B44EF2|nr:DUF2634 domain-containing protein [Clostridioides mangenotii]